jgi:hypothetical protein
MTLDTLIFDAGTLFFALWTVAIAAVTIAAFGRDLLSWRAELDPPVDHLRPTSRTSL